MTLPRTQRNSVEGDPDRHLRFNFAVLFMHGMLGQTGFRLLQAPTFLPTYLTLLAGNNAAAGIARAVQSLGMFLSPIVGARMVESRRHIKRLAMVFGGFMRLQVLFLALLALLAPPSVALALVLPVIGLWGLCTGLQAVAFNFLLSKAVPPERRGRLHGLRNIASGGTLLVVAAVAGYLLDRYGFPRGYGWSFLLAFVLTTLGLSSILFLHEPSSSDPRPPTPLAHRLRELPPLLHGDPHFALSVAARIFATAGRGALPFYVLYVGQHLGLSGSRIGGLTIAFTFSQSASAVVWGWLADRRGFRAVYLMALATWMMGGVLVLSWLTHATSYVVFVLLGSGVSGTLMGDQNLVLEFGDEANRAMRIATTNSLAGIVGTVAFLAGGLLSDLVPLPWLFIGALALQAASAALMARVVDPRRLPASWRDPTISGSD